MFDLNQIQSIFMKKIIFLTIAYLCMANAYAAYLRNIPMTLNQPDGSVLHCFASGDEYFNYLHDRNGYTIMIHPQTGYYVYAENREGELVATNFIAGVHDPASNGLEPYALISSEEWMAKRQAWEVPEMRSQNRDFIPNHGTLNNISIFIRFSDEGQFTNSYSSINNMFNNVSAGAVSMRSYFRAASYGAIEIPTTFYPGHNGETIISYQDIYPRSYFKPYNASTNTNGYQSDDERREREFALLERAVNYINSNYPVPSDLNVDCNDDGFVDNVCFIIRGGVGAWNSLLWPHQWELFDKEVYINGKRVWSFNFHLADATSYFNTSTMCHEMNHSLGAPDLYHYYYEKNLYQVGPWDLMHANATPPQHCGAYMKMKYGHWIDEIPEITEAGTYTLNPISSPTPTNVAYKILTDDPNQFYVLEYRDKSSMFETSLPGSGLLIYRINTSYHGNANYNPNEGIYDEVYLFRPGASTTANGSLNKAHHSSNVNRSEFSAATSAYPFFTNGTIDRSIRIYNITNAGNTISFTYGSMSDCEPPTNLIASIEDDDISLSWNAVGNASSYNIYKNGILIGSTSETTFLDSDLPYGSYAYYVKSVDSQGRRSVPSNAVTFVFDNYDISATAAPAEGGTVEGSGNYNSQTICTLEAMPNYGYIFVNWTENDSVVSTYDTLSFIVTKDRTFTANFQTIDTHWPMPQGYEDNMTITGTVNLDGVESTSDFIELAAFIGEECRGSTLPIKIGGQRVYFLTVAGNAADEGETLNFKLYDHLQQQELDYHCTNELNFQHDIALGLDELYEFNFVSRVQIMATADPEEGGTVSGEGTYYRFDTCSLTATAYTGYTFQNWTLNDEVVSTDTIYTFVVNDSAKYVAHFSLNSYDITATVDPEEGGTASGAGTYYHFDTCSLIATANIGYSFINWTLNDEVVSTDTIYTFVVSDSANYVAHFSLNSYDITATIDPEEGGTVSGAGTYYHFDTCSLIATANIGYSFINWTLDDEVVSADTIYTFVVNDSANYVAHFNLNSYDITATADPEEGGTVSGAGTYYHFDTCSLIATANIGYSFINWTLDDEVVSTDTIYTFVVSDSANYVAHFSLNRYDITVTADPEGSGRLSGAGIYYHFDTCTLTATTNMGYTFVNWTENGEVVSTDHTFSFEVTANRQLVANFNQITNHWTAVPGMSSSMTILGVIKIDGIEPFADYLEIGAFSGEECRGSALPQFIMGYCVYSLSVVGNANGDPITFRLYDHHHNKELDLLCTNVLAFADGEFYGSETFYEIDFLSRVQITTIADPAEGGTVEGGTVEGIGEYFFGLQAILTATANTGYTFQNWTLDEVEVTTESTYSFEVSDSANYVAHFSLNSYDVTVTADPDEGGTVTGAGTYTHGTLDTLTAMANMGYYFVNWTENGEEVSTDHTFSFEVTADRQLVANFNQMTNHWTAVSGMPGSMTILGIVKIDGEESFADYIEVGAFCGEECRGTALPQFNEGYCFYSMNVVGNTDGDTITFRLYDHYINQELDLHCTNVLIFTNGEFYDSEVFYEINFISRVQIAATADPTEGGTVEGTGGYFPGLQAILTATANTGYTFQNWTLDEVEVSIDTTYTFEVSDSANYVAHFSLNSYDITASANPDEGGSVNGTGTYYHYDTCTLIATAYTGYTFMNWTLNDEVVSTDTVYAFEVSDTANYVAHFNLNSYDITAIANPDEGGTVSGAGTYYHFDTCSLMATAYTGYTFQNWTLDDEVVSTDTVYTFVVSDSANYVAHFSLNSYDITAIADPDEGGIVSGKGTYYHFDTCTLIASANIGYTFVNWTLGEVEVSTESTYSFEVNGATDYVAHFSLNSYNITATVEPDESGTISGTGIYYHFDTCTLTATANTGYTFQHWTLNDEVISTEAEYTFEVSDSANYVAHFSLNSYNITATAEPDESGTISGAGIYYHFDTCTLTATANMGYTFQNWTLNDEVVSTDTVYTFVVSDTANYVAHFNLNSYNITATTEPDEGGMISGAGIYYHFDTCTLTATAATGYTFQNWTLNDEVVSTDTVYAFEVSDSASYVAHFSLNSYDITATADPDEYGMVSGAGTYYHFDTCTLTATANIGYNLQNWTLNDDVVSTDTVYTFVVSDSANYVAHFSLNSYDITAISDPDEGGTLSGAGNYYHFDTCTLTATANIGYTFINWTLDDEVVSTDTVYTFEVSDSASYVAHFSLNSYDITATADTEEGGTVSGVGTYYHFDTCSLIATANIGYTFINWTLDDEVVSTDAVYTFEVSGAATYVAHFSNSYEIVAVASPAEGGSVSGTGTYYHFDTCTLTATANMGYTFQNWTLNDEVVSSDTVYTFEVSGAAAYVAHFSLNSYYITATADPDEGGTMSGAGTYYHFDTCSLMATANIGYTFINWTLDDEVVSTDTIYTFVVSDSVDYVAHFSLNSYEITATADPDEDGTVSGAGTYYHFDTCTLIATAYTGYTFMNWTLDDEIVSTDAEYTFEVSGAGDYVAHFSNSYEIVAQASPVEGGIISGAGTYYHFDTCTLIATANENYLFNSWIVNGETVSTDTIFTFEVTGPMTVTALFYLVQTVELNQGWTWWSTSVEQSGINGLEMLENSLNPYGRVIKNADQFVQYNAILGWVGILKSLNNEAGYRVQTTEACTSSITGPVANPENHPITILPNWTWIGYPVVHQQTVTEALGNYEPQTNDLIKSQNSSARYIDNIGWIPANFSLKPGESYMYYSKALDNKTLVFANGGRGIVENKSDDRYWRNDVHAFADNLCLLAVVEIDGEEQRSEEVELGAFVNGECRGSAKLMHVEHFNRYYAMMNVMGEEGDEVKFALVDRQRNMMSGDSPAHLTFSVNAILGEFDDPFVVCFGDLTSLDEQAMHLGMYPNPVKCNQTFCILVPQEETVAELTIVNTLGSVVRHETGALNRPVVEGLPVPGVYLVRVVCKSGNVYQNRLVVKQ